MNLKPIIDERTYVQHQQPGWPSYQAVLAGVQARDPQTQQQIRQLFDQGLDDYVDQHRGDDIADGNRAMQHQTFYDKAVANNHRPHCRIPWETAGVNSYGDVFLCISPAWIPKFAGNILGASTFYDVLNSDTAQRIRREILNNRYYYCNFNLCGYPGQARLTDFQTQPQSPVDLEAMDLAADPDPRLLVREIPKNLIFDFDHTCNYRCPSCRTEMINYNNHPVIRPINDRISERIKRLIIDEIGEQSVHIRWAGGEPFISRVYVELLDYIANTGKRNIKHIIQTNGSYFRNKADLVEKLLPDLVELRISFDAATADTYHRVRVNGVWDSFLDNVTWVMSRIRERGLNIQVTADFVVQRHNYLEIPQLAELCNQLGVDHINYQKMWNWATWPSAEFDDMNVYDPAHPEYQHVVDLIAQARRSRATAA